MPEQRLGVLEAGLSRAGLAAAAGIHLRQIHRHERGEQQPALDVAQRLAGALDELAGAASDRGKLDCTRWAAWPAGLSQHGATVSIEALERSSQNERGGYLWRGELRLWDGQGRWVGLACDGPVISGLANLARTQEQARAVMTRLVDEAEAPG